MAPKKVKVIGFDINAKRVDMMNKGIDPSNELTKKDFANSYITFTHKLEDLKKAKFFITLNLLVRCSDQRFQPTAQQQFFF